MNAAGDVVVAGQTTPGDPECMWRIGISDPNRTGVLAGVVALDQTAARWAVATSGIAERGAHVSDPHTGRFPCFVVSATAVTRLDTIQEGAAAADACATALVAAGEGAPALTEQLAAHGAELLLIGSDGSVRDPWGLLGPA